MREFLGTILVLLPFVVIYVCVRAFFSSIKRSALRQEPRQNGVALEFFPTARMQVVVRFVMALLTAFGMLILAVTHNQEGTFYALLFPVSVFLLICLARPVPVVVDDQGIRQRRWFLPDKEIKWHDVALVAYGPNSGTTYVVSRNAGPK